MAHGRAGRGAPCRCHMVMKRRCSTAGLHRWEMRSMHSRAAVSQGGWENQCAGARCRNMLGEHRLETGQTKAWTKLAQDLSTDHEVGAKLERRVV
jgi:hypothetical protein